MWGFPKMVGFANKPMGFPTKNDQHLGCEMAVKVPPFKETPMYLPGTMVEDQELPPYRDCPAPRVRGSPYGAVSL